MVEAKQPDNQIDAKVGHRLIWPLAIVLVAAIFAASAGIVVYKIFSKPFDVAEQGGVSIKNGMLEIIGKGGEVVRKIVTDPKIEERYYSFPVEGKKVQEMVVYKMERLEYETKRIKRLNSEAHLGFIVPVEYAFYVDASKKWRMTLDNGVLKVVVPDIQHQRPNPYWDRSDEFVEGAYLITGEKDKLTELKNEYPKKLEQNASKYCDQFVVEQARASVASFLNNWISEGLKDHYIARISVKFESEKDFPKIEYSTSHDMRDVLIDALSVPPSQAKKL